MIRSREQRQDRARSAARSHFAAELARLLVRPQTRSVVNAPVDKLPRVSINAYTRTPHHSFDDSCPICVARRLPFVPLESFLV